LWAKNFKIITLERFFINVADNNPLHLINKSQDKWDLTNRSPRWVMFFMKIYFLQAGRSDGTKNSSIGAKCL